ncbi:MAG: hypothetical protein P8K76_04515 [Candidatus Binatia bacterium]|nr:hypothetical protein [Candidatus Binatia bacterium]MDG1958671.1 hypothetical protein [Candidatus Binatia bacterium]MDG2009020.1 hypothetical protein [Candidatus Binatia bacterium]HAC81622.1 hypothetical protein [Deltaproteobacteria bacterium]
MKKIPTVLTVLFLLGLVSTGDSLAADRLPDIFTLPGDRAFVPEGSSVQRNLASASKELARLSTSFEKCHSKGVRNVAKGKPHKLESCLGRAQARFESKLRTIENKGDGLPGCANFRQMALAIGLDRQSLNAQQYCASPAGAMVDGPILY